MPSIYSWDTNVIVAWFKGEEDKPLNDIELVFREIEAKKADLVVSIVTYTEVLAFGEMAQAADNYREFLKRPNVLQVNVDPAVAKKATEIREACKVAGRKCLKMPDATVAATAVLYKANVLHTFDDTLLGLSRTAIVNGLLIEKPKLLTGQRALKVFRPKPSRDGRLGLPVCPKRHHPWGRWTSPAEFRARSLVST